MTKDESLNLALQFLESMMTHQWRARDIYNLKDAIKEALAQPKQEPVAWMFQHEETGRMMFVEAQQLEWGFEKGNPRLKKIGPLYTTPPQRKPLTDEERLAIRTKWMGGNWTCGDIIDAVEAAHGIKGEE